MDETNIRCNGQRLGQTLTRMIEDAADGQRSTSDIVSRLATVAEVSQRKIREIMRGTVDFPARRWLEAFAFVLGVDLSDLILAADADTAELRRPDEAFTINEGTLEGLTNDEQLQFALSLNAVRRADDCIPAPRLLTAATAEHSRIRSEVRENADGSIRAPKLLTARPGKRVDFHHRSHILAL
jgi:hypothetical protein